MASGGGEVERRWVFDFGDGFEYSRRMNEEGGKSHGAGNDSEKCGLV